MNLRTIGRLLFLLALPPCSAAARSPDDLAREITRPDAVRIEHKLVIKTPAFEAAAQELLEAARGALDPSVVPALVEVLGSSSPGSKLVGADLARAIHPPNLVAVLAGLSEKGLPANADSVARILVKRLADYRDPAAVPGSQNGPWLRRGEHATLALDLGRVIRALGPGMHTLGLQYFSRSELRNWPVGGGLHSRGREGAARGSAPGTGLDPDRRRPGGDQFA